MLDGNTVDITPRGFRNWNAMESSNKTRRGRSSNKIPNVGKGGGSVDGFLKQMQINKSASKESDVEAEKVMDRYEGKKWVKELQPF